MKTWQQCCDYFNVNTERGLSPDQVKKNLDKYGPNGKCVKEGKLQFLTQKTRKKPSIILKIVMTSYLFDFQNSLPKKARHYGSLYLSNSTIF